MTSVATDQSSNAVADVECWRFAFVIRLKEGQLEAEARRMVHELSSI
jgi:hypothetical protein